MSSVPISNTIHRIAHRDMALAARLAKLKYVNDGKPGFSRKPYGKKFSYIDVNGKSIKDPLHLVRIKSLAIPPAWTNVWICPIPDGHLQATGYDGKGRKQYRYHPQWRQVRDQVKYEHMLDFGLHLPLIRQKVDEALAKPGLSREKVLATVVYLLENTMIRVGNDEYAKSNKSFGLTTLRNRHVEIQGSHIKFRFRGKSKIEHDINLRDARLARIIKRIMDLPGQDLFQYVDDAGELHPISSSDVNAYLKEITGRDYTAKDFRTWLGTMHTTLTLRTLERFENITQAKKNVVRAVEAASKKLGNTPSICRKCYVHPLVIECYLAGAMFDLLEANIETAYEEEALSYVETYIIKLLQCQLSNTKK